MAIFVQQDENTVAEVILTRKNKCGTQFSGSSKTFRCNFSKTTRETWPLPPHVCLWLVAFFCFFYFLQRLITSRGQGGEHQENPKNTTREKKGSESPLPSLTTSSRSRHHRIIPPAKGGTQQCPSGGRTGPPSTPAPLGFPERQAFFVLAPGVRGSSSPRPPC